MLTKNNWCTSNISDRILDKSVDFKVRLNPYPFEPVSFAQASEIVATEIANTFPNLFLSFSGGLDSDYIMRLFHRLDIPVTPIIVCYGNEIENQFAYATCKELGITPVVINVTPKEFLLAYARDIIQLTDGVGYNATQPIFAARYAEARSGTLLMGGHFLGDGDEIILNSRYANLNEWDFYPDLYAPKLTVIDPMLYTPQISYSMMPNHENGDWNHYKHELYNIPYRPKFKAQYSEELLRTMLMLRRIRTKREWGDSWTKQQFQEIMNPYIIANK